MVTCTGCPAAGCQVLRPLEMVMSYAPRALRPLGIVRVTAVALTRASAGSWPATVKFTAAPPLVMEQVFCIAGCVLFCA